ncbi:Hypothetical predicted protein [Marmota monax]|uniref:Uncharacterized protein n=1 Tax=Marmota monax TaxID=9995 RepID=A0A5E4BQW8_MARMO|nr:hypothetical protein GHT09_015302 [Marmota monax]VTJ72028.1 Hypothetical predicted protein [Marmota monax]
MAMRRVWREEVAMLMLEGPQEEGVKKDRHEEKPQRPGETTMPRSCHGQQGHE